MDAVHLLWELESQGVSVAAGGGRIFYSPVEAVSPELRREMERLKPLLMNLLLSWPSECLASEARVGGLWGRLIPLIGQRVWTPRGVGELGPVCQLVATVYFEDGFDKEFIPVEEINPIP